LVNDADEAAEPEEPNDAEPNAHASRTIRIKYSASGHCTVAHPAAPLGQHGATVTHEVTDIPPGVSTADVVRRYAGTAILQSYGALVPYDELGTGRILKGKHPESGPSDTLV
jgi:hypothetical protein